MSLQLKRLAEIFKHQPSKSLPYQTVKPLTSKAKTTNWRYVNNPKVTEVPVIIKVVAALSAYCFMHKVKLYLYTRYPIVDQKVVDTRVSKAGSNYWQDQLE
mmetsp:Transcript_11217/g.22070  ORF Transcript_11217/g.22070 Transcript_11217/m.22070 type:complete len:101 (+) Transcript_11217:1582-1884(+)